MKHRRGPSTPRHSAVSRDPSVRRSAQDDEFVGSSTKNTLDRLALIIPSQDDKRCVTRPSVRRSAQDDDFVVSCEEKHPNRLAPMGLRPRLSSASPFDKLRAGSTGLDFEIAHQKTKDAPQYNQSQPN
jgi:hypothetical protein